MKIDYLVITVILVVVGAITGVFGYGLGQSTAIQTSQDKTNAEYYSDLGFTLHDPTTHGTVEAVGTAPSLSVEVSKDAKTGYNLVVLADNYTFTPEAASTQTQVQNEGHAHLMINGYKVARLYSPYFHILPEWLVEGENSVMITLNANDHSDWVVDGAAISAMVMITK